MRRLEGPRAIETCSKSVSALENVANTGSKKQRRIEGTLSEPVKESWDYALTVKRSVNQQIRHTFII